MNEAIRKASDDTYRALCDSFNTPAVMATVSELVSEYNSKDRSSVSSEATREVASWITFIVNTFGLNGAATPDDITIGWSGIGIPEEAKPYLVPLSKLRDGLRQSVRSAGGLTINQLRQLNESTIGTPETPKADSKPYADVLQRFRSRIDLVEDSPSLSADILNLCDQLRDVDLWSLGIYLEDREGDEPALIRPITNELRAARQEREDRDRQKKLAKLERDKEAAAKAEKGRLNPADMFRTEEFTEWDEDGVPVKDREGKEIAKNRVKKLRKDWERQKKLHDSWAEKNKA